MQSSIVIQLYHEDNCCLGISQAFINEIKSLRDNDICVFFTVPKNSEKHLKSIENFYFLDNLYIDEKNIFILREGGLLPAINIINREEEILFHSPLFKDIQSEKNLIKIIKEAISLPGVVE